MVKAVAILLSMILLTQGFFVSYTQLKNMDVLLEHAKFHQAEYGDTMATFLDKHYGDLMAQHFDETKDEGHDHEQLPYHLNALFVNQAVLDFNQPIARLSADFLLASEKANFFYQQLLTSLLVREILDPPRLFA